MDRRRKEIDENQSQRRSLEQEVHDLREKKVKQHWHDTFWLALVGGDKGGEGSHSLKLVLTGS